MLSRFHDTRGEHGFDSHSSPGFQPDHSRSGWDYLLENWSHPRISTKVSNYFKTLKGENAFWRANWIITPLEGISPFEAAITGEEAGKEVERSRITSDDQEEKEAALKVDILRLTFNPLSGRWPLYSLQTTLTDQRRSSPWGRSTRPSSSCRSPTASFFPSIHTSTHFILSENRRGQLKWLQGEENNFFGGVDFFFFSQGNREDELVHPQLSRHQRSSQRNDCFLSQPDLFNKLTPMLPSIHKSSWIFIKFSEERTIQL